MNKNVHFVQTNEYYNDEFRIYDISYLSNDIILSTDLIGQLNYYKISDNSITKNETKEIYSQSDLDNLISLFSLDVISQNTSPEIIIGSSSGEVVHVKDGNISHKFTNNKSSEFSKVKFIDENIFGAGDTKGNLTIFDIRQKKPIKIFTEQSEEITDILYDNNKPDFLLSSSIDSTLSVYDLKKHSLYALSDKLDEELNCLLSVKGCNHILCGSGEGNILIFNWNWFGDFKDQIRGHPEGINTMDKYNDNVIFTGCEDGGVRICSMYPKGLRGILTSENNKKKSKFKDVNKIKISSDKNYLITISGIDCLRLYNISGLDFEKIYKSKDEFDNDEEDATN
jgi:WD40 repeat protein